jgi:hypothetical protein
VSTLRASPDAVLWASAGGPATSSGAGIADGWGGGDGGTAAGIAAGDAAAEALALGSVARALLVAVPGSAGLRSQATSRTDAASSAVLRRERRGEGMAARSLSPLKNKLTAVLGTCAISAKTQGKGKTPFTHLNKSRGTFVRWRGTDRASQ